MQLEVAVEWLEDAADHPRETGRRDRVADDQDLGPVRHRLLRGRR